MNQHGHPDHDCSVRELVGTTAALPTGSLDPVLTDSDTGVDLHPQLSSSSGAVDRAVSIAAALHDDGGWTGLPTAERAAALRAFQTSLGRRAGELARADSLDTGVPLHWTTALVQGRVGMLDVAVEQVEAEFERTEHATSVGPADQWRLPWGPAAVFLPWNAPAPTVITKIADALVAGCPVVVKASEWAPHFSGPLVEAVLEALPAGLVQVVHGDRAVGEQLVGDERIRAVSYTGGVVGGTAVAEASARHLRPVDLELSGNNPVVVLPDADPALVAAEVAMALQFLNGQICIGPRRLIVPRPLLPVVLDALEAALADVRIGPSADASTTTGPLAHRAHLRDLQHQLEDLAARGCDVRRYGTLPAGDGLYLQPAVVLADAAADVRAEIFGPVLLVRTYEEVDEAVAIANDHDYGLVGYVFGADRARARAVGRRLRAGLVTLNGVLGGGADAPAVGSMWGASGLGVVGAGQGPAFFSGYRFVG